MRSTESREGGLRDSPGGIASERLGFPLEDPVCVVWVAFEEPFFLILKTKKLLQMALTPYTVSHSLPLQCKAGITHRGGK